MIGDSARSGTAERRRLEAAKIALVYAGFGALWIMFSDTLLYQLVGQDASTLARMQTFKGWFFIGITAVLLYLLIRRAMAAESRIAERLLESESRFQAIFDGVNDPIFLHDPQTGRILDVNARACELYGYSREELCDRQVADLSSNVPPYTQADALQWFDQVRRGENPVFEWHGRHSAGHLFWLEVNMCRADIGDRPLVLATVRNIEERKRVEAELRRSEENLNRAQAVAQVGSWFLDIPADRLEWSEQSYRIFGVPPGRTLTAQDFTGCVHPDDLESLATAWQSALEGKSYDFEHRILAGNEVKWVRERAEVRFDAEGRPVEALGTVQDITERRLLEDAQRQLLKHLDTVANASPVLFWTSDIDKGCNWFNQRWLEFTGHTLEEEAGDGWTRGVHPDDLDLCMKVYLQSFDHRKPFSMEYRLRRADGAYRWLLGRGMPRYDADGQFVGFIGSCLDISSERQALEALWESEERLRLALQAAGQGLFDADVASGRMTVSPEYARMLGYDPAGFVEDRESWGARIHPEDRDRVAETLDRYLKGELDEYRIEFRLRMASGAWKWVLSVGGVVEHAADGSPLRMIGTHTDISARKQAEEELQGLNAELEQRVAERTAQLEAANRELESFSYSVSHDLKAPLRGIDGYSQILIEDYHDRLDDDGRHLVGNIRHGVAQMHQLIEDMLAYSRMERRTLEARRVDLQALVAAVVAGRNADEGARTIVIDQQVPQLECHCDRDGLTLVLRNLLENALKFTRERSEARIEIGARQEAGQVLLWVRDNGIGFDMQYHDTIFDMFQRLHRAEDYPGTGVGLALVKKAMNRMGGRTWAESAPGEGATFYLELPQ
ncbi:MAG TPA: PAS domain-containing protein [Rhodocyclaceae bacterium]|nr:PAS domain-containing protein [Rhodocyclaceae bacterium]HRQ45662.1 PAS domain-containing protein [Rhodocyclaceae bacterium]